LKVPGLRKARSSGQPHSWSFQQERVGQTCNYLYDDLQRLSTANCGALWSQNFTYDSFGNITKTGSSAFTPGYSVTQNQFTSIPGASVSYDANGNLLTDNLNTYTWDAYSNMSTVNNGSATVTALYDGLGRMVENNAGGSYQEFIYSPTGAQAGPGQRRHVD
jgi:hypothetical protein